MLAHRLPADLHDAVHAELDRAVHEDVVGRVWARDPTVWGDAGQPELADRLGWLDIADRLAAQAGELETWAQGLVDEGVTDCVLLGMGGSSLAPEVLRLSQPGTPRIRLHVLDSTDADWVRTTTAAVPLETTMFLVATKSGGTIETLSAFQHFWALKPEGRRYVAITDPGSPLLAIADEHGFGRVFENDPTIGGRYSALSYFGLVPAALIGADLPGLLAAATACAVELRSAEPSENPGLWLGATLGALAARGRDKLTFLVCPPVGAFGLWVEQLVAESTGKQGRGILPVADEPLRDVGGYGADRVFVHLRNPAAPMPEHDELLEALAAAGHPTVTVEGSDDPAVLGRLFLLFEFATAVAGWGLGINPFDQPNVAEAKAATSEVLEAVVAGGTLPEIDAASDDELRSLLHGAGPPAYVAIMGYHAGSPAVDEAVGVLRGAIGARTGAATTFGYGPRFLHSTGQLHKGGAKTGRFLQLVASVADDVAIPTTAYGFETLKGAQAAGDLATLQAHDLPASRVELDATDLPGAIRALADRIKGL